MQAPINKLQTQVCIAGGGPAGMMLGFLLARSGISVIVLENTPSFTRLPWRHCAPIDP